MEASRKDSLAILEAKEYLYNNLSIKIAVAARVYYIDYDYLRRRVRDVILSF